MGFGCAHSLRTIGRLKTDSSRLLGPDQADPDGTNLCPIEATQVLTVLRSSHGNMSMFWKRFSKPTKALRSISHASTNCSLRLEVTKSSRWSSDIFTKDIAEFHQRVYRFFRRRGWNVLFAVDWGFFERRFKSLLTSMAYRFDLVDREAAAIHFDDMKKARDFDLREYEKEEQRRKIMMSEAVCSWLSAAEDEQEEYLEGLSNKRQPGTCNWILDQDVMRAWVEPTETEPFVWMTGKPGGGKSVLASFVTQHLQSRKDSTVLYFFCAVNSIQITCADVLRTIAFQALQQNPDVASLVHQAYLQKAFTRSTPQNEVNAQRHLRCGEVCACHYRWSRRVR